MNPYQELANAIVLRATKDYRTVLTCLFKNPKNKKLVMQKKDLDDFFYSKWFGTLTEIDPNVLITNLMKEVQNK